MKAFITPSYTFTPGASGVGTIDLSSIASFDVKKLIAIINQTRGVVLYATGSSTLRYSSESAGVVTLLTDTSSHDAGDKIQVVYETLAELPTGASTLAKQDEAISSLDDIAASLLVLAGYEDGIEGLLNDIKTKLNDSLAVTGTFWQATQPVSQIALTASFQEITNLTTVAQTFTAPANAKWCKVMNLGTENIRMKIGAAASISSGVRLEPGRSEDFSAVGDISVIAETGTDQIVCVQFGA